MPTQSLAFARSKWLRQPPLKRGSNPQPSWLRHGFAIPCHSKVAPLRGRRPWPHGSGQDQRPFYLPLRRQPAACGQRGAVSRQRQQTASCSRLPRRGKGQAGRPYLAALAPAWFASGRPYGLAIHQSTGLCPSWCLLRRPPAACGLSMVAAAMERQRTAFPAYALGFPPLARRFGGGKAAAFSRFRLASLAEKVGVQSFALPAVSLASPHPLFRLPAPPGPGRNARPAATAAAGTRAVIASACRLLPAQQKGCCQPPAFAPLRLRRGRQGAECLQNYA